MTITGGVGIPVSGGVGGDGGAIRVTDENLALDGVVITGNTVGGTNDGGGIGITSVTNLVIRNSTVSGNTAADSGGGIYFFSGGSLLLENSTVSGNSAPGVSGGGGIYFFGTVAASGFTIRNSTIANNSATNTTAMASGGGGIVMRSFTGTALIQESTISGNTSASTSVTDGLGGGGIALATGSASILTLQNTIVAGNTSGNLRPDISAIATSTVNANFCLIGIADTFTLSGTSGNNLTGTLATPRNPMLGALASNGGPTLTMLPDAASSIINAGSNALIPSGLMTDQRGLGFPRIQGGTVDIGSIERAIAVQPTVANAVFNFLTSQSLVFTFDQAVNFPSGLPAAIVVHNNTTNTNVPFNAVQSDSTTVTLTPTGVPAIFPDGDYTATVLASNVRNANGMNMAANFNFNFFFLNGDANHDRHVNLLDFNLLAGNFNQLNRTFSQGDFNYDGQTNLLDFNILASRFNSALSAAQVARQSGRSAGSNSMKTTIDLLREDMLA